MNEFKLSYTANEIDQKLNKIDNLVSTINGIKPDANGNIKIQSSGGIIDVTELPTENISESGFYRLVTATIVYNQNDCTGSNYICYCVDGLPETGLPATNASMDIMNVYYNVQDGIAYGYVDEILSAGLNVPSGWYNGETLMAIAGQSYGGAITDIDDDPCDDVFRIFLKYDFYIHKHGWMKLPFACEKETGFDIKWDNIIGDRIFLDTGDGFRYVKISDEVLTSDEVRDADIEFFDISEIINGKVAHNNFWLFADEYAKYTGAFSVEFATPYESVPLIFIVYDADAFATSLGIPTGIYTNGIYFLGTEDGSGYVSRLAKAITKITKIDSKFIEADFSEYAKISEVNTKINQVNTSIDTKINQVNTSIDTKINQAIGNAIGGSY